MKKTIITLVLAAITAVSAAAQEPWSLKRCIDYALEHNIAIRQQELSVENSQVELNTARNSRLPGLNASAGQNFNFGRSPNMATGVYEANQSASTSVGVSASATIFSGMRIAGQIEAGELNLQAAVAGLARAKENLGLNVASYYLEALFRKELLTVAEEQVKLTESQLEKTRILVEEGRVPESQRLDMQAQLARNRVAVTDAENAHALALLNLAQALNLPGEQPFDIREPDTEDFMSRNALGSFSPDDIYDIALGVKPQVRQAEFLLESSRSNVKIARSARYPSLSLGASYNSGYSHIFDFEGGNDPFFDQIRNNQRQSVGVSLSIPIFNRLQSRNQIRSAQIGVRSRELELDNVKQALYKEIQQAHQSATAAQARYGSTGQAYEAALAAYEAAQLRYEVGRSSVYEFAEAQMSLFSSRSEQVQAKYEYLFRTKILDFYRGEPIELR